MKDCLFLLQHSPKRRVSTFIKFLFDSTQCEIGRCIFHQVNIFEPSHEFKTAISFFKSPLHIFLGIEEIFISFIDLRFFVRYVVH